MEDSKLMMTKWVDRWKSEWVSTERWTDSRTRWIDGRQLTRWWEGLR